MDVGAFRLSCWQRPCRKSRDAARSRSRRATEVARLIRGTGRTPRSETPSLGFVSPCRSWFPCGLGPQATRAGNHGYGSLPVLFNPRTFSDQSSGNIAYSTGNRNFLLGDTLPETEQKNKSPGRCSYAASAWRLAAIAPSGAIAIGSEETEMPPSGM